MQSTDPIHELLLVAKLRAMEETQDGRIIKALLGALRNQPIAAPDGRPSCDCGAKASTPEQHGPSCSARLTFAEHVNASIHEWDRANALALALRELHAAVGAEVAIHPGMHDAVARAFKRAGDALSSGGQSHFPGDDGLPFNLAR